MSFQQCEGESEPSSAVKGAEGGTECVEGILVEVEQDDREVQQPREVCLADERGEELDLIIWEDIQ